MLLSSLYVKCYGENAVNGLIKTKRLIQKIYRSDEKRDQYHRLLQLISSSLTVGQNDANSFVEYFQCFLYNGHVRPPDTTKHERTRTADSELFHINAHGLRPTTNHERFDMVMLINSFQIKLPWADHDDWLRLPTIKDENSRTRNGGDFHVKTIMLSKPIIGRF